MTYCAGWKYNNSVYLLADTLATKSTMPSSNHTSFGELHAEVRGDHVEESLLKLVPIGPGTAIAYSGDVQLANHILNFLKDNLDNTTSIRDLLSLMETSMGPFNTEAVVALLVATSNTNGDSELIQWSTKEGINTTKSDYYQIGSLTSYHAAFTPNILSYLAAGQLAPDRMLPVMTAIVQSYGIHDNLIDMNVGGLIFGLRTEQGRVIWQEDSNYFLYSRNLASVMFISAMARDNALIVHSSLAEGITMFAHSVSMPPLSQWDEAWRRQIEAELESDRFRYWIFISTEGKVITLIIRNDLEQQSRLFRLALKSKGLFDMAIKPELMSLLSQPLQDTDDDGIPFRLNVRND
ncbi:MAG: hypothetical protein ACR65R_13815 [Methylomicrobium sp.]